jgi:hypothetical protein
VRVAGLGGKASAVLFVRRSCCAYPRCGGSTPGSQGRQSQRSRCNSHAVRTILLVGWMLSYQGCVRRLNVDWICPCRYHFVLDVISRSRVQPSGKGFAQQWPAAAPPYMSFKSGCGGVNTALSPGGVAEPCDHGSQPLMSAMPFWQQPCLLACASSRLCRATLCIVCLLASASFAPG